MVSFDHFSPEDGIPIYQQLLLYLKRGMVAGTIKDGDELPSRRVLSARLGINPNTVQKAYRLLEEEGLMVSRSGAKSYAVVQEEKLSAIRAELMDTEVRSAIGRLKLMGLTKDEVITLFEKIWR